MDSAKAVKATAHQLARLTYAMLTRGEQYVERDLATMEMERRDRQIKNLQRQARHFDLALVPAEQAAPIKMRQFIFTHTSGPVPRHAVLGVGGVQ